MLFGTKTNFCTKLDEKFLNNNLNGLTSIEFESFFDYEQFFSFTNSFLKQFHQLKKLKLNVHRWEFRNNVFGRIPKSLETFTLILPDNCDKIMLDSFKCIIWDMSNLHELNLECYSLTDELFYFITNTQLAWQR